MMENLFLNNETIERIKFILGEYGKEEILLDDCSAKSLSDFIDNYNWDDGFEVPYFIMNHSNCDLGIALKMFYMNDGLDILDDSFNDYFDKKYVCFVELLYNKIKNEEFKVGVNSYVVPLSMEDKEELINDERITKLFLTDVK